MAVWALDIETTTDFVGIRLAGLSDGKGRVLTCENVHQWTKTADTWIEDGDFIIGHNLMRFDFPMLKRLWKWELHKDVKIIDTLILSKILHPDIPCGHSMAALCKHYMPDEEENWKQELPEEYASWPDFYDLAPIPELDKYLQQDLVSTRSLWRCLTVHGLDLKAKYGFRIDQALKLEQRVAEIVSRQVETRVRFDIEAAQDLHASICWEMRELEKDLDRHMPYWPLSESKLHYPPKVQFKKDGTLSTYIHNYLDKYEYDPIMYPTGAAARCRKTGEIRNLPLKEPIVKTFKLSLSNQTELKLYLQEQGWKPTMWNVKKSKDPVTGKMVYTETSARLTDKASKEPCPNLEKMGISWIKDISRWLMLRSRKNVLQSDNGTGWIPRAIEGGGYLPSEADTLGANTGRFTHKIIANVPRVSSAYGKEMRSLFTVCDEDIQSMVGWDASSLEACVEAHYVHPYDPDYAEALVSGDSSKGTDVHSLNVKKLGLPSRDLAKTFKYAITYGAQPPTLAAQLSVDVSVAKAWFEDFWAKSDGLRMFKEDLTSMWEATGKKYIMGLDGRPISTRSQHSLVNAEFQSAGAIIMKYAMVLADARIRGKYPAAEGLIRYHDEEQWQCYSTIADSVGEMGVQSIVDAGIALKLNVPLGAEYKVGKNWAETH